MWRFTKPRATERPLININSLPEKAFIYVCGVDDPLMSDKVGFSAVIYKTNETVVITGGDARSTKNAMELRAAIMAFEDLDLSMDIRFIGNSNYVVPNASRYLKGWIKKRFKGIENAGMWRWLAGLLDRHTVDLSSEPEALTKARKAEVKKYAHQGLAEQKTKRFTILIDTQQVA